MLIRFNVKNFLSFSTRIDKSSEEFSMIAGKVRNKKEHIYTDDKIKILKFAAVFGANASGKSNLVKALDFMRSMIIQRQISGYSEKYCKTDSENKTKPSYFEVEMLIEDRYYAYGFEMILNQNKIISEWLIELKANGSEKVLFERDVNKGTYEFQGTLGNEKLKNILNIYANDIKTDESILFLSLMNTNKKSLYKEHESADILRKVYDWFLTDLDINYPDRPISDYSYMSNKENVEEICKLISAFGTGITNYKIVEVPPERVLNVLPNQLREKILSDLEERSINKKRNKNVNEFGIMMRSNHDFFILEVNKEDEVICKTIQFQHGEKNTLFNLYEESDGTIRILDLLEILLSDHKTFVVDELDRCLHPSLTYKFIETYLNVAKNKDIQLIVTTHESRLMDFDLLRRDEIWFVDKRYPGFSDMYSLEEYNSRFDQKIDKAYLDGRYGGVPLFDTIFPFKEEEK